MTGIRIRSVDADKRDLILKTAVGLFAQLGFKKASVDVIAQAAGVAKGTVYLACSSKADLFYQAVHSQLRRWLGKISQSIDPRVPADQLLTDTARESIVYLDSHPLVRDLLLGCYAGLLPGWEKRFEELRDFALGNVREILRIGVKQGIFREELDLDITAQVLQDLHLSSYMFHQKRVDDSSAADIEQRFNVAMDIVIHGLRRSA